MRFDTDQLTDLLEVTAQATNLYVPAVISGTSRFALYGKQGETTEPNFELQNTKIPPKVFLFPSTEKLYTWGRSSEGSFIESALQQTAPFVMFGIRPCDIASIERMDEVFLTKGYVDEFYESKRNAMTTVALACNRTSDSCFCDSLYSDPNEAPSADILLLQGEGGFEVRVQSEKGEALAEIWKPFLKEGGVEHEPVKCAIQVNMDGVAEKLHNMFNDPLWDEVSTACLTCGSCTFICPTCHCFDLSQAKKKDENARFRCWDSCMFKDYTLMAGNHNPREQKRARVRQRFMHKLCFFEERYGSPLCVGCGRCLIDCPATMDITAIIDKVNAAGASATTGAANATAGAGAGTTADAGATPTGAAGASATSTITGATASKAASSTTAGSRGEE